MLNGAYQTVSAVKIIVAKLPAARSAKYMYVNTPEKIIKSIAPVVMTDKSCFRLFERNKPAIIKTGMRTNKDKKFIL
jgi:phosphoketolase